MVDLLLSDEGQTCDDGVAGNRCGPCSSAGRKDQGVEVEHLQGSVNAAGLAEILVCGQCVEIGLVDSRVLGSDEPMNSDR